VISKTCWPRETLRLATSPSPVQIETAGSEIPGCSRGRIQSVQSGPSYDFSRQLSPAQRARFCVMEMCSGSIEDGYFMICKVGKVNLSAPVFGKEK